MLQPGIYEHYKGGRYRLVGEAVHSETLEALVLYEQLYETPDYPKGTIWARPKTLFEGEIEIDGKKRPRFRHIKEPL